MAARSGGRQCSDGAGVMRASIQRRESEGENRTSPPFWPTPPPRGPTFFWICLLLSILCSRIFLLHTHTFFVPFLHIAEVSISGTARTCPVHLIHPPIGPREGLPFTLYPPPRPHSCTPYPLGLGEWPVVHLYPPPPPTPASARGRAACPHLHTYSPPVRPGRPALPLR